MHARLVHLPLTRAPDGITPREERSNVHIGRRRSHPRQATRLTVAAASPNVRTREVVVRRIQLVPQRVRSCRTDAQRLSRRGVGSPDTPTTPTLAVKVGPSARAYGAPLTGLP